MRSNWGDNGRYTGGRWLPFSWHAIPVTRAVFFGTLATFLLYFLTGLDRSPVWEWIPFRTDGMLWLTRPWTWLTYALLERPTLWVLITFYMLYSWGGMLERSWGSRNYAVLLAAFTAVGALAAVPMYYLLGKPIFIAGLSLPLTALVTAWAALDPDLEVQFWGVPVKARLVAAIVVVLNYLGVGMTYRDPVLALFALAPAAAAWLYVRKMPRLAMGFRPSHQTSYREPLLRDEPRERDRDRRPSRSGGEREQVNRGFNPMRKRQEQLEIDRLRKLLGDDDDRPIRRN